MLSCSVFMLDMLLGKSNFYVSLLGVGGTVSLTGFGLQVCLVNICTNKCTCKRKVDALLGPNVLPLIDLHRHLYIFGGFGWRCFRNLGK